MRKSYRINVKMHNSTNTTMAFVLSFSLIGLTSCFSTAMAFSSSGSTYSGSDLSNEGSRRLWNEALFETMPPHLAYYKFRSSTIRMNDTTSALRAIEDLTCLNFTQMSDGVKRCRDPWTICTTIDSDDSLVFTTTESGQKQLFSSTTSALGIAASVVASLGLRYELNRMDRDDHLQLRFEFLRDDVIVPATAAARSLRSQLFVKCKNIKHPNPFDYFSITLGDIEDFQNDDVPMIVTKDPHNMWKLYVRMPTSPKLSVFDRFYLTEKQCSKELAKDGKHCDPHKCKHGFLLHECLCVCLPGYTGPKCNTKLPTPDKSASLGFPLPSFPVLISSPLSWVHQGLELTSDPPETQRRFLWSAQLEAPPGAQLHIALFPAHLQRHLQDRPADLESVHVHLLYTHGGPTLYRALRLAEHLPVVTVAPRLTRVTLLLRGDGDRPLTPLLSGSPLVTRHAPDPLFHLRLARSPRARPVLLAHLANIAHLPEARGPPAGAGRMGGGGRAEPPPPPPPLRPGVPADPLRHYLPLVLGVICGMWFVLLAVAILCYVQSDRGAPPIEPPPSPPPPPPPPATSLEESDDSSPSDSSGSSGSPPATEASGGATSAVPSSDDGSVHVQFAEPPTDGRPDALTVPAARRASMNAS